MATTVETLGQARVVGARATLGVRLSAAITWLLEHSLPSPDLICGDTDSSLLAIGRDLAFEDQLLYRGGLDRTRGA